MEITDTTEHIEENVEACSPASMLDQTDFPPYTYDKGTQNRLVLKSLCLDSDGNWKHTPESYTIAELLGALDTMNDECNKLRFHIMHLESDLRDTSENAKKYGERFSEIAKENAIIHDQHDALKAVVIANKPCWACINKEECTPETEIKCTTRAKSDFHLVFDNSDVNKNKES